MKKFFHRFLSLTRNLQLNITKENKYLIIGLIILLIFLWWTRYQFIAVPGKQPAMFIFNRMSGKIELIYGVKIRSVKPSFFEDLLQIPGSINNFFLDLEIFEKVPNLPSTQIPPAAVQQNPKSIWDQVYEDAIKKNKGGLP